MNKLIELLPNEIINIIIFYSIKAQPINLLEDIKNYITSRELLYTIYFNYCLQHDYDDNEEYKYWILNDLLEFSNNYKSTMHGYTDYFYEIFSRNILLVNKEQTNKYLLDIEDKTIDTTINIFWGLFTIEERFKFLSKKQDFTQEFNYL